jgi:tetratricopeptide (TPR) repeat protein
MRVWLVCLLTLAAACAGTRRGAALTPEEQARVFLDEKRPEDALPILERLHQERPDDLEVARGLVDAHVRTGRTTPLIDRLEAEVARRPTAVSYYMLGLAQFACTARAEGPTQEAFLKAIAIAPRVAELQYRLGIALLESEQEKEALHWLEQAAQLEPGRTRTHLPLAKARLRSGDRAGALRELRAWVDARPPKGEVPVARRLIEEVVDPYAGYPQAVRPKLEAGLNWLDNADMPQEAIVSFEEILHDFPDLAAVHGLLGLAYQRIDDAGRAVDEFHRAIELDPSQAQPYLFLGELYLGRQRPDQAREAFQKALEHNPLSDRAYLRLGELALERQDGAQARQYLEALASLNPDDASVRGLLANALLGVGDVRGADRELKRALQLQPENLEFSARLGLLHADIFHKATGAQERQAERAEATRYLEDVLKRQPENAIASRALEGLRE